MHYSISKIILQWAIENQCELIISAAGMPVSEENTGVSSTGELKTEEANEAEAHVVAAASTTRALEKVSIRSRC
jgi:predicted ATP-grasp superfamily ATP-dependent carboligase